MSSTEKKTVAKWAVYVQSPANAVGGGDYRSEFFGHDDPAGGTYVHSLHTDSGRHEVQFRTKAEAVAFARELNTTGDWPEDNHPVYAVAKL